MSKLLRVLYGLLTLPAGFLVFYFYLATPEQRTLLAGLMPGKTTVFAGRYDLVLTPPAEWKEGRGQQFVSPDGHGKIGLEEVNTYYARERAQFLEERILRLRGKTENVERLENHIRKLRTVPSPTSFQKESLAQYEEGLKLWRKGQRDQAYSV